MIEEFTLLYVEDNKDMQNYMKELLKCEIKEFYHAYNGEEGFEIYKDKRPDVVINDIKNSIDINIDGYIIYEKPNVKETQL